MRSLRSDGLLTLTLVASLAVSRVGSCPDDKSVHKRELMWWESNPESKAGPVMLLYNNPPVRANKIS